MFPEVLVLAKARALVRNKRTSGRSTDKQETHGAVLCALSRALKSMVLIHSANFSTSPTAW